MAGEFVNLIKVFVLFSAIIVRNVRCCPTKCLCYLEEEPRKVLCSNQGFINFPVEISDSVEHLDLSNNNLHSVPVNIDRLTDLKYINLSNNKLTNLPETVKGLWKLEKIDLSNNLINNIGRNIAVIENLPNLKLLHLRQNPINSLDGLINKALRALDVSQCDISQLNNNSLVGLPELISLHLDGNPLISIQRIKSEKLRWLDLSNCMLNLLLPDTFEDVPELEQLRMANNQMLVFSTRKATLRHAKLKRLDVSKCNLDRPGTHGFPLLTHAKFSGNIIRFLPDRIFSQNKMLTHLYLNENSLSHLNSSSFAGLAKLTILDLSRNVIENLPETLLKDNINLRLLNLSHNNIKNIPAKFPNLAIILDLSSNLIENIPPDHLNNMPRLRSLNLSKNRLEFFNSDLSSSTLKTLILKDNRLVKLTNKSFVNLSALTSLDLSGNRLTEGINYEVFQHNINLEKIILQNNPWHCNCEQLYPAFHYLIQGPKIRSSTLICQSPNNVSGSSWAAACHKLWNSGSRKIPSSSHTNGLVLMCLLIAVLVFGSCVSIGHTIKAKKRQAALRLEEAERTEAIERLLHHRRCQMEELRSQENIPRVHPVELIGPPTYEEAVEMPRLVQSLENLNSLTSIDGLGQSVSSLNHEAWLRKRRKQKRKRMVIKRVKSADNLDPRCNKEREHSTIKKNSNRRMARKIRASSNNFERHIRNVAVSHNPSCSIDDCIRTTTTSSTTPNHSRKIRRLPINFDGHSSDDEDSDVNQNLTVGARHSAIPRDISIIDLPREPRSGTYRPPTSTPLLSPPSSPELFLSPEPCDASFKQHHVSNTEVI